MAMKKRRRIRPGLLVLICVCCLVFVKCKYKPTNPAALGWTDDKNQHEKLSDYKGKVVLLSFYATWCDPCRAEVPHLVQLQRQYEQQGLKVIGLNVGGDDDRAKVPGYAKEFGIEFPLAYPDDELVFTYLGDNANIPQTLIFDRQGKMVKRTFGYSAQSADELDRVLQATLAQAQ